MNIAVLDYSQLDNIPSFLETSEYVISGVVSFGNVNLLFANGNFMRIALSYFKDMGVQDFKKFDLSEDGQCIFFGEHSFEVAGVWGREHDERVVRSGK